MKNYRVYYHKRENFPQVWSIDEGSPETEIHVQHIQIMDGCTPYSQTGTPGDKNQPAGWFVVVGRMEIDGALAIFHPR